MRISDIHLDGIDTILLDRDGVINKLRPNDYVKTWEEFEFIPDIFPFLKRASSLVKHIFVVTNQRGVGRNLMTLADLKEIHSRMLREIVRNGGRIDEIFTCTSVSDDDVNRKPNIGMWNTIRSKYPDVKSETAVMIGDTESDMKFADNCGIKGIRII